MDYERGTFAEAVLVDLVSGVFRKSEGARYELPAVAICRVRGELERGGLRGKEVVGKETVDRVFHNQHHCVQRG